MSTRAERHSEHVAHIRETLDGISAVVACWPEEGVDQIQCTRAFILAVELTKVLSRIELEMA